MPYGSNFPSLNFRTTGAWGPGNGTGTGGRLTNVQADENTDTLGRAIEEMLDNPVQPNDISNITVSGNQMTITLEDGTEFGPFTIPTTVIGAWKGEWAASTSYNLYDTFVRTGEGVFLVIQAHTSASTFDADATDSDGALYTQLSGADTNSIYDFSFGFETTPAAGAVIDRIPIVRNIRIPADFAGDGTPVASGDTPPAGTSDVANYIITLKADGVTFGTVSISPAGVATWATSGGVAKDIDAGSVVTVHAPDDGSDQDGQIEGWVFGVPARVRGALGGSA